MGKPNNKTKPKRETQEFEQMAEESQKGLIAEFIDFLLHNKKWWLTPIILVLLLVSLLILLAGSGAAPFIYPFF